jgi:hypothetical protein
MNSNTVEFDNKQFHFIKRRQYDKTYEIYHHNNEILRIGPADIIQRELDIQTKLLSYEFPIPVIYETGQFDDDREYILEEKLGDEHFGEVFKTETVEFGEISEVTFIKYKLLLESFINAQTRTAIKFTNEQFNQFLGISHLNSIGKELVDLNNKIDKAISKIRSKVEQQDFVLSHGDFNPHNIYENGIIDLESFTFAPLGYDLGSALDHIYFFPDKEGYEMTARYEFNKNQYRELENINEKYIPNYSNISSIFKIARCAFATVEMHHTPKVQEYRYEMFKIVLEKFLNDEDVNLKSIRKSILN